MLVFCKVGLGRTGTIAARLAVELGCSPHDAIERVRAAREGAIETVEQESYVSRSLARERPHGPPILRDRIEAGLVGLLVGDALGVPYEFHGPRDLPRREWIDMIPPHGFARAHTTAPPGTWSDDGHLAVDAHVFDSGGATHDALVRLRRGASTESSGGTDT